MPNHSTYKRPPELLQEAFEVTNSMSHLQCWCVFSLIRAIRMTVTAASRQRSKATERLPAIFASVFTLLTPFIKFVFPLIRTIRMTVTATGRQRGY